MDALSGRKVTPNTGASHGYEGVQRSGWATVRNPDRYQHDRPQRHGYPYLPGVLDAAVASFDTAGIAIPWLALQGNHDQIFVGTFGPARGLRIDLVEPMVRDSGVAPVTGAAFASAVILASTTNGNRRLWQQRRHGRGVVTVGTDSAARRPIGDDEYRLVAIANHHNSWSMDNHRYDAHDPGPGANCKALVALLNRDPHVILWFNGYSHQHRIAAHPRRSGPPGGFWEVSTSSLAGFPQQGRTFEVLDNGDDTLSIITTVLDHAAPPSVPFRTDGNWTSALLASLSRELAANDDRWFDPLSMLASINDRNVELPVPAPFPVREVAPIVREGEAIVGNHFGGMGGKCIRWFVWHFCEWSGTASKQVTCGAAIHERRGRRKSEAPPHHKRQGVVLAFRVADDTVSLTGAQHRIHKHAEEKTDEATNHRSQNAEHRQCGPRGWWVTNFVENRPGKLAHLHTNDSDNDRSDDCPTHLTLQRGPSSKQHPAIVTGLQNSVNGSVLAAVPWNEGGLLSRGQSEFVDGEAVVGNHLGSLSSDLGVVGE